MASTSIVLDEELSDEEWGEMDSVASPSPSLKSTNGMNENGASSGLASTVYSFSNRCEREAFSPASPSLFAASLIRFESFLSPHKRKRRIISIFYLC